MPRAPHGSFLAAASTKLCGRQVPALQPAVCLHILASVVRAFKPAVCQRSNPYSLPAASTKPCGGKPLLFERCSQPSMRQNFQNPWQQLPPGTLAAGICCWNVDARRLLPSRLLFPRTFLPFAGFHTSQMLRGRGFAIAICSYGKRSVFLFHFLFFFAFLLGTCQCFSWHRFPDGVTCVTAMRPHDCDDQTTVEHTGQLCA